MSSSPGFVRQLWFRWKALKLPWRKQFLVGSDLSGNTFWEFRDQINTTRFRRIVKYPRETHYSEVKIPPQWHQWLRHTRREAPTIEEQQQDVSRQAMMKQLAAEADERWNSIPSYLDAPNKQQPQPAIGGNESSVASNAPPAEATPQSNDAPVAEVKAQELTKETKKPKQPNPWANETKGAPSQNWQPEAWSPGVAKRR